MPAVQNYAKNIIVEEFKEKLGTDLGIGQLHFQPFNAIQLDSVYLYDQSNTRILLADKITADVDLFELLNNKLVFTSARLSDVEVKLSKDSTNSALNIQYIIDAFKSKEQKPKSKIAIKLSSVSIDNGSFYYDVKDKTEKHNAFDANHIHVSGLDTRMALKSLESDSLNIQIKKLNLKEKSGFEINNLTCRLLTQGKKASLRGFRLDMPSSFLQFDKCDVDLSKGSDGENILDYATVNCIITPSYISPKDVAAFAPALENFKDILTLKAEISGSLDDIKVTNLTLDYGDKMHLVSNSEIKDLRNQDKMYILGSVDDLTITTDGIEGLLNNLSKKKTSLPKQITNLGTISFQGDVSGYLDQLTAFGSFETALGIIKTDILFGFNKQKGIASYCQGKVYTSDFSIGKLMNDTKLNKVSLALDLNMQKPTSGKLRGKAEGIIRNFDYNGYTYKDITLNANYDGLRVDGNVNIEDPNGNVNINGLFDLSDKNNPELDFTLNVKNLRLDELKLVDQNTNASLSFNVNANFKGKNIDNAIGSIQIDSLDLIRKDKQFLMDRFTVEASGNIENRKISITSDILNGEIAGAYSFTTMVKGVQQTLHHYLPALIKNSNVSNRDVLDDNLTFKFQINNTEQLSNALELPVTVLSPANIIGFYNGISNKFKAEIFTPSIKAGGTLIKSGYILAENPDGIINSKINALVVNKKGVINDIGITMTVADNTVNTSILYANDSKQKAKAKFDIATVFTKNKPNDPLLVDIDVLPSGLLLNNAVWKMDKSHISIQEGIYTVDNFIVHNENGDQEIKINGSYSNLNPRNILKTELKNIDLTYIFQTLSIDVLKFGGQATGSLFVSSIEKKPYANTRLKIKDFSFNGTDLGELNLFSELDDETNKVALQGEILSKENKKTTVDGILDPVKQGLSINFDADSINIGFLGTYASSVFNKVEGRGTGKVHLHGDFSNVTVEGKAFIENGKVGISFLNTDYAFTDTIYMKDNLIYFNDVSFTDINNNHAIGSGKVSHDYFRNFMYYVELSADNFMLYNITEKQNPLFFGRVYASGKGSIGGDEKGVDINVSMKTEDKTSVRLNFMENVINEYAFITYKDNTQHSDSIANPVSSTPIQTDTGMDINMNFYIDATPEAVVELVMDPVGGDVLRGSGSGALQFTWSTKSAPRLYGNYLINRGSYNFTFQKIVSRKFEIENGSSVQFKGDPFDATLDVNAIYKVMGNLNDLSSYLATTTGQTTIQANCILNLSGPLKQPNVKLDVMFPTADAEVQRQIKSLMNTEDMINRQVTYLLLLSKFFTPDPSQTDQRTSDFASVASATLSNQLSKIINRIDSRWQLGTNIRTSDESFTSTEVELILSSKLLNDRLLINGNFGYKDDPNTTDAFIGDIDLELLLNNTGTWRIKAYNHYNEKYYYTRNENGGPSVQTQGVGLVYKKDFDHLRDLFNFRESRKSKSSVDTIKSRKDSIRKDSSLSHFIKLKK